MKQNFSLSSVIIFITIILLFSIQTILFAQDKAAKIEELMQFYNEYGQFDGAVLVAEKGKVIIKKGYGLANREWNISNETDTRFQIGSLTKQFTAMLIMQLIKEEKIKLEGKIIDYLTDYRKDTGEKISIHHLLSHTSGLPNWYGIPNWSESIKDGPFSVEEHIKIFCSGDLDFQPGTSFGYSNPGYCILGAIIEKVTGKAYEQCLRERIFEPLNMRNSGYAHHKSLIMKRANGYVKYGSLYQNVRSYDHSIGFASGMLYSTVEDLYLWDQALYTDRLISNKFIELMFKPYSINYGYGWCISKIPGPTSIDSVSCVFHSGHIFGFHSSIRRITDHKHVIVLLSNTESRISLRDIEFSIIDILYNRPFTLPQKHVADTLDKIILDKGVEYAIKKFHELKKMYPNEYDFSEEELAWLGEGLVERNMLNESMEIYKLIIELSPDWWRAYKKIGDINLIKGNIEKAIKFYAKSLEINPEKWYAKKISKVIEELTEQEN